MEQLNEVVERYLAVWNEPDAARRRELIAQTWTEDASYIDPLMQGTGHAGIDVMVQGAQTQFAHHRFRRVGTADGHHDHIRFSWELVPESGPTVIGGTDVGVLAADGRLRSVVGFLDHTPASAE